MDQEGFERRWRGRGSILPAHEYDAKLYMVLNGGMHDAAIVAWGVKRHYDYGRPITAIRYLSGLGQSSDERQASYNPLGIKLMPRGLLRDYVDAQDNATGGGIEMITLDSLHWQNGDKAIFNSAQECRQNPVQDCVGRVAVRSWDSFYPGGRWILGELWFP